MVLLPLQTLIIHLPQRCQPPGLLQRLVLGQQGEGGQQARSVLVLSESGYRALTGEAVELAPGQTAGVLDATGSWP